MYDHEFFMKNWPTIAVFAIAIIGVLVQSVRQVYRPSTNRSQNNSYDFASDSPPADTPMESGHCSFSIESVSDDSGSDGGGDSSF